MITETELIRICQENDNTELKKESREYLRSQELREVEICVLIYNWINPIKDDNIDAAKEEINNIISKYNAPSDFIKSREWEKYKGNVLRFYKHYDLNSFYYLCRSIYFYYVKEKRESIEELFLNTSDKYHHETICRLFGGNSQIQNEKSSGACANLNMMLKYLAHDIKSWKNIDKNKLLIPATHKIIMAAHDLLIINNNSNALANAKRITEFAKELLGDDFMSLYSGLISYYNTNIKK